MAEMIDDRKTASLLNDLIHLDFDAIAAYEAAIARLTLESDKGQLARFMDDHRRHVTDLSPLVRESGAEPATEADFKKVLTKGKVIIAGLMGDRAILEAMKSNEDATNSAYEKATRQTAVSTRVRLVLERNLGDERRHRAWIEQRLASVTDAANASSPSSHR